MSSPKRWALITGVSEGGLGDALTQEFLARDINVVASSIDISLLKYLQPIPGRLEHVQLDVTITESISAAVGQVSRVTDGRLDFLVNNAGYGYMMPLMDASVSEVKRNYDVNVFGVLAVTQAFFPLLRSARGLVVNQSSIAGLSAGCQPFIGSYSSSKAAVTALSNTMRVEFAPFGVKVITLMTGDVRTKFWQNAAALSVGLPESSLYAPIKGTVEAMMHGHTNPPGQHTREAWAKEVVSDLLQRNPSPFIRRGYLAIVLWLVSIFVPVWILDFGHARHAQLGKLKEPVQETMKVR